MKVRVEKEILPFQICVSEKGSSGTGKSPKENTVCIRKEVKEGIPQKWF